MKTPNEMTSINKDAAVSEAGRNQGKSKHEVALETIRSFEHGLMEGAPGANIIKELQKIAGDALKD